MASDKLLQMNEQTDHPLNGSVSPAMHPRMLDDLGPVLVDQEHSGTSIDGYAAGRSALKALYSSADAIQKAREAVSRPLPIIGAIYAKGSAPILRMQVLPEKAGELSNAMAASAARAAANVERNSDVVDRSIAKLNSFIAAKTSNSKANETAIAHEAQQIRQYVSNLKEPSRQSTFLKAAVDDGDHAVVTAVLGASPFASGLSREQHQILRSFAEQKFAGPELRQRDALVDVAKKIQTAMSGYALHYSKMLPKVVTDPSAASLAALKEGGA